MWVCVSPLAAPVLNGVPPHTCHPVINNARITPETQPSVTCHSCAPKGIRTNTQDSVASIIHGCLIAAQTALIWTASELPGVIHHPGPTRGGSRAGGHTNTQAANLIHTRPWTGHTQTYLWGWTSTNTHKNTGQLWAHTGALLFRCSISPPSLSLLGVIIFSP